MVAFLLLAEWGGGGCVCESKRGDHATASVALCVHLLHLPFTSGRSADE